MLWCLFIQQCSSISTSAQQWPRAYSGPVRGCGEERLARFAIHPPHLTSSSSIVGAFWVSLWPRQFGQPRTKAFAWLLLAQRLTIAPRDTFPVKSFQDWLRDPLALTRNNVIGLLLGARPDRLWDWLGLGLGESHHKEQPRKGFVCAEWDITKSFN